MFGLCPATNNFDQSSLLDESIVILPFCFFCFTQVNTEDDENDVSEDDSESMEELECRGDRGRAHGRGRQCGRGSQHHRGRGPLHGDENRQNIRPKIVRPLMELAINKTYGNGSEPGRGHERGQRGSMRGRGDEHEYEPTRGRGNEHGRGQRHGNRKGRRGGREHTNQQSHCRGTRQESQQQNILDLEDSFVMDETGETRDDSDISEETYSLSSISDDNAFLPDLHRAEGQKKKRGHGRDQGRGQGRRPTNQGRGKRQDNGGAYSRNYDQATYEEQGRRYLPKNTRDEPKTTEKADNFVLIKNLDPESTEDSIAKYVERVLKTDVKRITFGTCDNKTAALVQIKQPPGMSQ